VRGSAHYRLTSDSHRPDAKGKRDTQHRSARSPDRFMDNQIAQDLIDAVNALRVVAEEIRDALAASGKTAMTKAGKKPGAFKWNNVEVKALSKQWPGPGGFFKSKIGTLTKSEWFDTKSKAIAEILAFARDGARDGVLVNITYDEKQNGQYTNRYLATIEIVEDSAGRAVAQVPKENVRPAEEELEESPF
jgi:hypothetical protein